MQGVGPGSLLGGRYALRSRLSQGRDLERWSAHDSTLEREVALTIVGSDHPNRAGVLDAARRAAGVEDARLVRILDVGNQDGGSFIVEEATSGSESLAAILLQGPLPAEEARRIAGETARGLETASQRGLHHLRLTPSCVLISHDGGIRVSGVAVAAAIDGPAEQEPDPEMASRRDAVCLVAVTYAALTGRWPLDEPLAGVEPAPRVASGVAAPSEIVAGVPDDLDTLCRMTLNEGSGPPTPGEFATQIAPWSRDRIQHSGAEATAILHLPSWGVASDARDGIPGGTGGTEPTVETATEPTVEPATAPPVGPRVGDEGVRAAPDFGIVRTLRSKGLLGRSDPDSAPLPMLPASTALPASQSQSKIVVLVVASFVTLSLFVGYCGLRDIGGSTPLSKSAAKPTAAVTAPPVPPTPAPATGTTVPTGAGPIAILSATGFDPEGDGRERNSEAGRVYDSNVATVWTSEGYGSVELGGLKKGAGVLLDLGQPRSVHQVTIDLGGGPVDVTAYAATGTSLEGATAIGTATAASGQVQLTAAGPMPEAQYLIVWFTRLAPAEGGKFRASIAEIALT